MATTLTKQPVANSLSSSESEKVYSVEELFDIIDRKFVDFYGEYGRQIVNNRRDEWNKKGIWEFRQIDEDKL